MQAEISSDFKFCDLNHKILKYKEGGCYGNIITMV